MIYDCPPPSGALGAKLDELRQLRLRLEGQLGEPIRWIGSLRRQVRASSISSSTSIEGFSVTPEEAVELSERRAAVADDDENRQAVACYARAMDHVGTMAGDPDFRWLDRVILDLHFDACYFQRDKDPGLWRKGPIGVTGADGALEYRGPDAEEVPTLMAEVVTWLQQPEPDVDEAIRAAMAHLNVISIHPFRDGNGRISRIVQSLVLAREGARSPEFFSIEEHLGTNTQDYYAALREVQAGSFQPRRDATSWVEFCLDAHIAQARRRLAQIEQAAERWSRLEALVEERGWPDRLVIALEQGLSGRTDRTRYGREAEVSSVTASSDLRRLVDAGLLRQHGRGPSTGYQAAELLREHGKVTGD
ncbi:MAG TPA: Fic family protein [Solirubrobacterales bacterium]|nr:Fic family protein [Solirubrobacterales bacterium]